MNDRKRDKMVNERVRRDGILKEIKRILSDIRYSAYYYEL